MYTVLLLLLLRQLIVRHVYTVNFLNCTFNAHHDMKKWEYNIRVFEMNGFVV